MLLRPTITPGGAMYARAGRVRVHCRTLFQAGHACINRMNLAGDACECCGDIGKQPVGICRFRVLALQLGDGKQRDGELRANRDQLIVFRAIHHVPSHLGIRRHKA